MGISILQFIIDAVNFHQANSFKKEYDQTNILPSGWVCSVIIKKSQIFNLYFSFLDKFITYLLWQIPVILVFRSKSGLCLYKNRNKSISTYKGYSVMESDVYDTVSTKNSRLIEGYENFLYDQNLKDSSYKKRIRSERLQQFKIKPKQKSKNEFSSSDSN